ncbi:MAG: hypothetical protein JRI76_09930 [Deltaproteobacteria bacterium]|nr:hypothetical protein [Deltaproteobacteria bacterium]MBW2042336.1 hypothetical protein [Deltaproteobacteria bacterium]MBW2133174.1 hypothetical protein [Deltaproteobacteria bacterium]
MKTNNSIHLNDEEILSAVIDTGDLDTKKRVHLSACPACQERKSAVEAPFVRMGDLASRYTPRPAGSPSIVQRQPGRNIFGMGFRLRPMLAAAIGILLMVTWIGWQSGDRRRNAGSLDSAQLQKIDDAALMAEVDALIDGALPEAYRYIAWDPEPRFTDDFIQFVAPLPEDDSLSLDSKQRGEGLWQTSV